MVSVFFVSISIPLFKSVFTLLFVYSLVAYGLRFITLKSFPKVGRVPLFVSLCLILALSLTSLGRASVISIRVIGQFATMETLYLLTESESAAISVRNLLISIRTFTAVAIIVSGITIFEGLSWITRPMPLGLDPNYAGTLLVIAFILTHYPGLNLKLKRPIRLVLLFGVVMTGSRTALICLGAALNLLAFSKRRESPWFLSLILICDVLLYSVIVDNALLTNLINKVQLPVLNDLLSRSFRVIVDPDSEIRLTLWSEGLNAFYGSPLIGLGPDALYQVFYVGQYKVSHSFWISIATSTGIVGLVIASALFLTSVDLNFMDDRVKVLNSCLLVVVISSLITGSITDKSMWMILGFLVGQKEQRHKLLKHNLVD